MPNETNDFSASASASASAWLLRLFEDLRGVLTFEQALHAILEHVKEIVPHQSVAVLMVEETTNELSIRNARNISYSFIKKFLRVVRGNLIPRVLLKYETVCLSDAQPSDPDYAEVRLEHDFKALCLTPVIHHQRVVGYLHCDRAEGPAFSDEEVRRLRVIAILINLLMEKFELLELTRHLDRIDDASKALKYDAFLEEYYRELARAKTYHHPLSLIFVEIDEYSRFVAASGVSAGHILLNEVRGLIVEAIRSMDVVGRFSADQFIICLGGMKRTDAGAILDAIRQSVQASAGRAAGHPVTLTGVAMTFERPDDFEVPLAKMLAALGSGLITAQSRGSNQAMIIDPPRA